MRTHPFCRAAALVGALCSALPASALEPDSAQIYEVDLAGGALHDALLELANELEVSLFFAKETVAGLHTESIQGQYTLEGLFSELLGEMCLTYEFVRVRLVAISPGCATTVATDTADSELASVPIPAPVNGIVEEIVVRESYLTGSRMRNPAFGQSMPLDVIDQTEIRLSGYQSVGELLRYLPAVSGNSTSTLISNGGDGTATVTLRGLPASNTLVLLNGRRLNTDALRGSSVDLNTLPLAMVEQIEILKDGVSAIYGSDAVAGVVNIITKQNITGMTLDVYTGQSSASDLQTQNLSFVFGGSSDNWSISAGLNYYDQHGVRSSDRRLSRFSDDRPRGGIDKRSSATSPARISLDDDPVILIDGASGDLPTDFRLATSEDRFEFRDFTSSIVPSKRTSAFANVSWDFAPDWQAYFEGLVTDTDAENSLAPVPLFTAFESMPLPVAAGQAFNPFGVDIDDVRRRLIELPARQQTNETTTLRGVTGIRHRSNGFNLDVALLASETEAREILSNGVNAFRIAEALSDDCTFPCVPLNVFGPAGSITDDMLGFIGTGAKTSGTSQLLAITLDVDWIARETAVGDIEVSAGGEYRHEELKTSPDQILRANGLIGGGNRSPVQGSRDIFEAYAEVFIPLARHQPMLERLDLQLAVRVSRYSDFGFEVNPRMVLSWMPVETLTWRASVARGFRAPTLLQLHGGEIQSFDQLNDPCSVAGNVDLLVGCDQQSDPLLSQFLSITGGDKTLDPERSLTYSVGMLWQPHWGNADLAFSLDWYSIEQEDVVESSAQFILNQNARLNRFDDRVSRNVDGNIDQVLATLQNIGRREVNGFDLTASMIKDFEGLGRLTFALNATHIAKFEDKFDPETPSVDKAGTFSDEASGGLGGLPDWKLNAAISWQRENWQGHYNIYHVSELTEVVPLLERKRTIDSWTTHNTNMSYLGPKSRWIRVTLGVNNLFNQSPPFSAAAFNDSYDGRTYDITGRYYFLKFNKTI